MNERRKNPFADELQAAVRAKLKLGDEIYETIRIEKQRVKDSYEPSLTAVMEKLAEVQAKYHDAQAVIDLEAAEAQTDPRVGKTTLTETPTESLEAVRAAAKSEARKELAEITAKLFPELREAIRSAVWSETETIQGAMSKALDNIREKAGRERAVRELEALAKKENGAPKAVREWLLGRAGEIAKEGK